MTKIETIPMLLDALKRKIDNGEEILVLKHMYDLSEAEMRQLLELCENEGDK